MNLDSARTLALVVARGGSKSIPRKNLALLAGKPLIAWTIEAAASCRTQLRVVVSTDDDEIARVAARCGAEVPFMRPAALAEDATPTTPVVRHALDTLAALNGYAPERVLLLQPTSPLRTAADVDAAVALFDERDANAVVSVGPAADHPDLLRRVSDHGVLEEYSPHSSATRRQELEQIYALNGAIYLARRDSLLARDSFYAERTYAYVMPPERSIDVDDPWDLHLCDLILRDRLARD
ncbi:MAG TPA: acylneuraminate cytidylyltransferase family protein [Candidatus Dormibacteraeota bacterium]|nr:acylneuraminate cytidylyltransferase family protein [Candidatus Dormibacteraeota bacterium]